MSNRNHNTVLGRPRRITSTSPYSASETHDTRLLDSSIYEQTRGRISAPLEHKLRCRRFWVPVEPPANARWAIEDRKENLLIWSDLSGGVWERGPTGHAQASDIVSVPVWWEKAGTHTEAYFKESTRLVIFRKLDGKLKILYSLPEDVSVSTHSFFGYFPQRDRAALWFSPMTPPGSPEISRRENGKASRPPAAVNLTARRSVLMAVLQGVMANARNVDIDSSRRRESGPDNLGPLSEEMDELLSLVEDSRLPPPYSTRPNDKQADETAEKDFTSRPASVPRESPAVSCLPRSNPNVFHHRLRTNNVPLTVGRPLLLDRVRNELASSKNDAGVGRGKLVEGSGHRRPEESVAVGLPSGESGEISEASDASPAPRTENSQKEGAPDSTLEGADRRVAHIVEAGRREQRSNERRAHVRRRHEGLRHGGFNSANETRHVGKGTGKWQLEKRLNHAGPDLGRRDQVQRRHDAERRPLGQETLGNGSHGRLASVSGQGFPATARSVKEPRAHAHGNYTDGSRPEDGDGTGTRLPGAQLQPSTVGFLATTVTREHIQAGATATGAGLPERYVGA